MTTLSSPTVVALLDRLYADADVSTGKMRELMGAMPADERRRRMSDPDADYRQFYGRMREVHMPVSRETGRLLYMLARATNATRIIEFGTSFGLSTIHLAAAVKDNGGGRIIGSEFEPGKLAHARANLEAAGLADLVDIRDGDAIETLARDLPDTIDLVLFDGHKALYPRVLALVEPRLRPGACLVADNADAAPDYIARVRGPGYVSVPFADDVELSVRM